MECWGLSKRNSCFYWLLMLIMIHLFIVRQTQGNCIEEERKALLEIKASNIKSFDSKNDHILPTWVDYGSSTPGDGGGDCCDWERISCNTTSGHVTEISLGRLRGLDVYIREGRKLWALNVSLFLHFKELKSLNLSYDFLDKEIMKTGVERLSSLKKLEVLDLSFNTDIDNDILPSLNTLTSLKVLDLSHTGLNGNFPTYGVEGLSSLKKLEVLDLSWNYDIDNGILPSLRTLTSLKILDLSYTGLKGNFPTNGFAGLENLEMLDLAGCSFNGTFEIEGSERVSILRKLKTLTLGHNRFNESVITSLSTLSSLTKLDLSRNAFLSGTFPAEELSHLTNLEELDLSYNQLKGTPHIQACKSLSKLKRLKSINLSSNNFNKSIISCLSALPSLKILDLSDCRSLGSSFPVQEFLNLFDLEVLLLGYNGFNGTLPMEAFTSFHHLRVLDLSGNNFVGSIQSEIKALSSLQVLSLANNNLNDSLSAYGFCDLKNLHELDLSYNMLDGTLPQCFKNLSSLKFLDISSNRFTGIVVPSTSLEYIDFSQNKFEGSFSFSSFCNHSKIKVIRFSNGNDNFEVETEEPIDWIPMFQLKVLVLPGCNINRLKGGVVPGFLLHQHKLLELDMSHNRLKGQFPNWLIKNNMNLEVLKLRNNSLIGSMPLYWNANMKFLDMSGNQMVGIPNDIPKFFPNIIYLDLSKNFLTGVIPSSVGDLSKLMILDLSDNELSGEVPKGLFTNISGLEILKLSRNKLYGEVLSGNLSLFNIGKLHLDSNNFTGKIGSKSSKNKFEYEGIGALDISNNFFTGMIPYWIGNMSGFSELVMRDNSFQGRFPCGAASFSFLDISQNSFFGPIPSCSNWQSIEHIHLGSNRFTGLVPNSFRNLTNVLTLDMSDNNLSGRVPEFIGELSDLRNLLLRNNNFSGSIPKQLCQLNNASLIDLAENSLAGSIPSCFQNIIGPTDLAFLQISSMGIGGYTYSYGSIPFMSGPTDTMTDLLETQDEVQFTTKSTSRPYKGDILDYMAGLDLSCNKLTGEIPEELGLMTHIHALNLSHNQLTGPIPVTFSNLMKVESLDLSSNGLTGNVPSELSKLTFLSTFYVSHNNLSGRLPEMKAQFGTFTKASYEGNPLLCGLPLEKCTTEPHVTDPSSKEEGTEKWYDVDMACFYGSSSSTCVVFLLGFVALLYVNPYWRRRWLDLVEECMYKCCYFFYDSVRKLCMIFRK